MQVLGSLLRRRECGGRRQVGLARRRAMQWLAGLAEAENSPPVCQAVRLAVFDGRGRVRGHAVPKVERCVHEVRVCHSPHVVRLDAGRLRCVSAGGFDACPHSYRHYYRLASGEVCFIRFEILFVQMSGC